MVRIACAGKGDPRLAHLSGELVGCSISEQGRIGDIVEEEPQLSAVERPDPSGGSGRTPCEQVRVHRSASRGQLVVGGPTGADMSPFGEDVAKQLEGGR